jgi:hypothetical protein
MSTNLPVKAEPSERELLAAAKTEWDTLKKTVELAYDTCAAAVGESRRRMAEYFGQAYKVHGTTQTKMAAETGVPPSTVSALCGWYARGLTGLAYGPQRKAHRNRQVECLIVAATTPELPASPPLASAAAEVIEVAPHEDISHSHENVSRKRDGSVATVAKMQKLGKRVETKIKGAREILAVAYKLCDDNAGFEEFKRKFCPSLGKIGIPLTPKPKLKQGKAQ